MQIEKKHKSGLHRTVQFFRPWGEDGVGKGLLTVTTVLFDSGS